MLGSTIPRRWVISLALVGLVTIFAVSYSAMWTGTASADSEGTVPAGTGNSVVKTADQTLESAQGLPTALTLQPGQQIQLTLVLIDANGNVNNALPHVTYTWTASGGISIVSGGSAQTVVIEANSSGTLQGKAVQVQETQQWQVIRDMSITVTAAAATSTPSALPTNPGTPPSSIPNSQGVVTPEGTLLVSSSGLESGSSAENSAFRGRPVVYVRVGSVSNFYGLQVNSVSPSGLPPMPTAFLPGSSAADITFVDGSGVAQTNFRLLRSAQVCLPTSGSDLTNGISNVKVLRFNSAVNQWVPLTSTYNVITQQVCANASNFSTFAVGVQQIPSSDDGAVLPATGGWSPTSGLLLMIGLIGVALVGGGAITMRRAKNAARPE